MLDVDIRTNYETAKDKLVPWFIPIKKKITYIGLENVITEGPNIITGNHPGIGKDIAGILTAYEKRQLYFTASEFLFTKETTIAEAKNYFGLLGYKILSPIINPLAEFLSSKMTELEMIPIKWRYNGNYKELAPAIRKSVEMAKDYLRKDRAAVFFQMAVNVARQRNINGEKYKDRSKYHNYIYPFNNTVAKIAQELYKEDILVPVTPIAFYGGTGISPFKRMTMIIGRPAYISEFMDLKVPVSEFTGFLEQQVAQMLVDIGIPRDKR
jgi:hypothetical protein